MLKTATIQTREDAGRVLSEYAIQEHKLRLVKDKMEEQISRIKSKYREQIQDHEDHRTALSAQLQDYCESTAEKSISLPNGVIGFRTSPPKIELKKNKTWEWALEQLRTILPGYIKTAESIDKRGLLTDLDREGVKDALNQCGMDVLQDEKFFIKLT